MARVFVVLVCGALAGCGRFNDAPKYQDGEKVQYRVPHMQEKRIVTGTGVVIRAFPSANGWCYDVDMGKDSAGKPFCPTVSEKMLSRLKK